jgi:hypothetical protein
MQIERRCHIWNVDAGAGGYIICLYRALLNMHALLFVQLTFLKSICYAYVLYCSVLYIQLSGFEASLRVHVCGSTLAVI